MNELIKIDSNNKVSGRELHDLLEDTKTFQELFIGYAGGTTSLIKIMQDYSILDCNYLPYQKYVDKGSLDVLSRNMLSLQVIHILL